MCLTHAAEKIITGLPEYKKKIPLKVIPCSADLNLFDPAKMILHKKNSLKKS